MKILSNRDYNIICAYNLLEEVKIVEDTPKVQVEMGRCENEKEIQEFIKKKTLHQ